MVLSGGALLVLWFLKIFSGLVITKVLGCPLIAVFFLGLAVYLIPRVEKTSHPVSLFVFISRP
jgi:hypothetical protein